MDAIIIYAIMLFFLALIIGVLITIIYFLFKFPKDTLLMCIFFISICVLYYKYVEREHRLGLVPASLHISSILYANEESWGWGPGANETGIIVYELPDDIAKQIQKDGVYDNWNKTPIISSDWIYDSEKESNTSQPTIGNYLGIYWNNISIDPVIQNEINNAISKSGSYFVYTRHGILIVMPDIQKVVYAYRG